MQDLDIFENGRPQGGKFFYFKNVGDRIQGTYIDVREGRDTYGNDQFIYVLKDKNGEVWNIGVRKTNGFITDKMKGIRLGQIIGFSYDEDRESKKSPTGKAKVIHIYDDPAIVDHEWLAQKERVSALYKTETPVQPSVAPATPPQEEKVAPLASSIPKVDSVAVTPTVSEGHQAIRNLAITKGLTEEVMAPAEQDAKIEAYAGLPISDANMAHIVIKLAEFKK